MFTLPHLRDLSVLRIPGIAPHPPAAVAASPSRCAGPGGAGEGFKYHANMRQRQATTLVRTFNQSVHKRDYAILIHTVSAPRLSCHARTAAYVFLIISGTSCSKRRSSLTLHANGAAPQKSKKEMPLSFKKS